MHSSELRGTDFDIYLNNVRCDHAEFFRNYANTRRLGLLAPNGFDGVGAVNLVLAYVTAFYDTYRMTGDSFFAYPDFFSFQSRNPVASYGMFDIWPEHKDVYVGDDPSTRLNAINDRGVNVLIVADKKPAQPNYHKAQLESARRNIDTCYAYSFEGQVDGADLIIQSQYGSIFDWAKAVFETPPFSEDPQVQQQKSEWVAMYETTSAFKQSYRTITLEEALALL